MNIFSKRSRDNLSQVDARLVILAYEVLKEMDITVIEGHRTLERQLQLYKEGKSQRDGISVKGYHNHLPSRAFDAMPYAKGHNPFDGSAKSELMWLKYGEVVKRKAKELGLKVTWGGDWTTLRDYPHVQIED